MVLGYIYIPYVLRIWKLGYLNVALRWASQFSPIHEIDEKLTNFQMLANRQDFQIFPNSERGWKLRWPSIKKKSSNEQKVRS